MQKRTASISEKNKSRKEAAQNNSDKHDCLDEKMKKGMNTRLIYS